MTRMDAMLRRDALRALSGVVLTGVGAVGAGCTSVAGGGESAPAVDMSTESSRLRSFVAMRGALDERLVIGCLTGRYYGVIDTDVLPLFGVASATFSRYRRRADGGYLVATYERAYYTDLASGAAMDQWSNPINGQVCKVPIWQSPATQLVLAPDLSFHAIAAMPPGVVLEQVVIAPPAEGGEISFIEQVRSSISIPGVARPYRYSEIVTLRARLGDLVAPVSGRVPCNTSFSNISGWRAWQRMGDQPGHLMGHGVGRYGAQLDQLPTAWLEATRRSKPELLTDPGAPLDVVWKA